MWKMASLVALAQPSSAAVERVFSRYRDLFTHAQQSALFSLKRLAVMLSVNERIDVRGAWRRWGVSGKRERRVWINKEVKKGGWVKP